MPHALVILENHLDASAYQFLFDNAERLYDLGYNQMLFELNDQHEPSVYMNNIRERLPYIQDSPMAKSAEMVLKVYDKFCALGFMCRFIDPESEQVAVSYNRRLEKACRENNVRQFDSISIERTEATRQRDVVMAQAILEANESSRTKGGVIFVGGFLHHHLIKQLEIGAEKSGHPFRYAIFHGKPRCDLTVMDVNQSEWFALQEASYRASFYGTDTVIRIDPSQHTFEMIKAILKVSPSVQCAPSIASYFKEKTGLSFNFSADEQYIVSASLTVDNVEERSTASKIRHSFPGLSFFSQHIPGTDRSEICIPGTNLADQRTHLLKGR